MEMSSGHNPSFTWRSIVSFKVVLKEWFWWKLGDEVSIDVWKQPWLRSTNIAYIQTPMYPDMEHLKVSDPLIIIRAIGIILSLIIHLRQMMCKLSNVFLSWIDQREIIKHTWAHSKCGTYTVRNAYRIIPQKFTNYNTVSMHGDWKLVWDLEIVMRVKVFMWRLSRDCLPTKTNVLSRGSMFVCCARY